MFKKVTKKNSIARKEWQKGSRESFRQAVSWKTTLIFFMNGLKMSLLFSPRLNFEILCEREGKR